MNITPVNGINQWSTKPQHTSEVKESEKEQAAVRNDKVELHNAPHESVTYSVPKKLEKEQVDAIRAQQSQQQLDLLYAMSGNMINQSNNWLTALGKENSLSSIDLSRYNLPALATNPEDALAAISPGGAYSVDAVATRIFDMATAIAGDDPEMLEKMRDAVGKGFKEAGLDFKKTIGQDLPDISYQTYDEIMKRFDERAAELATANTK